MMHAGLAARVRVTHITRMVVLAWPRLHVVEAVKLVPALLHTAGKCKRMYYPRTHTLDSEGGKQR